MAQAPHTSELDDHLKDMVDALHRAVSYGLPHTGEPEIIDKAIADCKEVLDVVMEGKVSEWVQ